MAATNHHGTDDQLTEGREFSRQRCCDGGISEAKSDISTTSTRQYPHSNLSKLCENLLGGDNFEEDREDGKRGFRLVHDPA